MRINQSIFENHVKSYKPEMVIFKEGDHGEEMYVIIEGEVEIRKRTSSASTKTLIVFHTGDIFGEMALVEKKPRSASAVTIKPSRLLVMNEALLESMIKKNPDFAMKMIRILSERLRKANSLIQSIMCTNQQSQVLSGLKSYAREYGTSTFKGLRVNITSFLEWARDHLGIAEKEVKSNIQVFLKNGTVKYSAKGNEEILIPAEPGKR